MAGGVEKEKRERCISIFYGDLAEVRRIGILSRRKITRSAHLAMQSNLLQLSNTKASLRLLGLV